MNFIKLLQNRYQDKSFSDIRFKRLADKYPHFYFPSHLYDIVGKEEFQIIEDKRFPIFVGHQFGINPRIKDHFGDGKDGVLIAILNKSVLSGLVSGLKIVYYKNNQLNELAFYSNLR